MIDTQRYEDIEFRIANLERAMLYLLESRQRGLPWSLKGASANEQMECQSLIDWIGIQR